MNQVLPHSLWLGHAGEARDFRALFGAGIQAVVDLAAEEPPSQPPRELIYCRFPVVDGEGNPYELLRLAVDTVAALFRAQVPTLVLCSMGMSRAPAVAAAALALVRQERPEKCLEEVLAHHPSDVSPGLWREVDQLVASRG